MPGGAGVNPVNRMQEVLTDQLLQYQGQFLPIEQFMSGRLSQVGSDVTRRSRAATGFAGGITGAESAVTGTTAGLTSRGVDPTSGRFASAMEDISRARGIGAGMGSFKGSLSAEEDFFKMGMENLSRAGAVQRRGILGLSRASYYQNVRDREEQRGELELRDMRDQIKQGWWNMAGTIAGAGAGAYGHRPPKKTDTPTDLASAYIGTGAGPTPGAWDT